MIEITVFKFNYFNVAASAFANKLAITLPVPQHWLARGLRIHQNLKVEHVLKERKEKGRVIFCMLIQGACENWL